MAAQICLGSFQKTAGTGAQAITGIVDKDGAAFTPKAAIFWCAGAGAQGFSNADAVWSDGLDDGTHAVVVGARALDGSSSVDPTVLKAATTWNTSSSVLIPTLAFPTIGIAIAGHVTAWSSGGFTFTWTSSIAGYTGVYVSFMAIGGSGVAGIVGSKSVTDGGVQTFSGLGLTPTTVFLNSFVSISNANHSEYGFAPNGGWANVYGCMGAWAARTNDGQAAQLTGQRIQRVDSCLTPMWSSATLIDATATITSMTSGQFVLTFPGSPNPRTDYSVGYLALAGVSSIIGSFARGLPVTPQHVTGFDLDPIATLVTSDGSATLGNTVVSEARIAMGGRSTGHGPDSGWSGVLSAATPTATAVYHAETVCIAADPVAAGASSTLLSEISTVANVVDGVQLFYSDADAVARSFLFCALGTVTGSPGVCPTTAIDIPPTPPPDPGTTRYIRRERIFPLPFAMNLRMTVPYLEVLPQPGVGLTSGQGSDPQLFLSISKDGGMTYGNEFSMTVGKIGEYLQRYYVNRLGQGRNWVVKLAATDPVTWYLLDCFVEAEPGLS